MRGRNREGSDSVWRGERRSDHRRAGTRRRVIAAIGVACLATGGTALSGCSDSIRANCHEGPAATVEESPFAGSLGVDLQQMVQVAAGVYIEDLTLGDGADAAPGNLLRVAYSGWLWDGRQFDSSLNFPFELGAGTVIAGWDLGVDGMKEGGTRRLVLAPGRAFGACDNGPIPGNSVVVFDVELLEVG